MNNSWQQRARQLLVDENWQQEVAAKFIEDHTLGPALEIRNQGKRICFWRLTFSEIIAKDELLERAQRGELYRLTGRSPIRLRTVSKHMIKLLVANQQVASVAILYARRP